MASTFVQPDEALAAIVGREPVMRNELTEKVMDYVIARNLLDKQGQYMITADELLLPLFDGNEAVSMFKLNQFLVKHITDLP
jgi:chromatin remodeling complex protein RSC6